MIENPRVGGSIPSPATIFNQARTSNRTQCGFSFLRSSLSHFRYWQRLRYGAMLRSTSPAGTIPCPIRR